MKFLSTSKMLNDCFRQLCQKYNRFEWIVAWAGDTDSFNIGQLLSKYENKIEHLVVGLHFYQTHPNFIKHFMSNQSVKFIKQTDGVFHPKLYLFYNNINDWAAIIGSANFTCSGFNNNVEANICITSNDCSKEDLKQIKDFIKEQWKNANSFSQKELEDYIDCWKKQRQLIRSLSISHKKEKNGKFYSKVLDLKTWDEYEAQIINHPDYKTRKLLLDTARKKLKKSFASLETKDRNRLSGCPNAKENQLNENPNKNIDWEFFGTTGSNGVFHKMIIDNNELIARAIDSIPIEGHITKEMYLNYIDIFLSSMPNAKNPLALITRLLAMKRPDVFVCINKQNKKGICKQFGIPVSKLTVKTYWDLLIERIMASAWYDAPKTELFPYRVAMLDCLHYKEK